MRAAIFHAAHDIRIEEVPEPGPLTPTSVLVRPLWCGICGTDLHEYTDGPIFIPTSPHPLTGHVLPQVMGHEFSAVVEEVGADVIKVRAGDRVSVMPLVVCGRCEFCQKGLQHLCVRMGATGQSTPYGGIAELSVLEDYQVNKLPDGVSDVQGAIIEPAAVSAYGVDRAGLLPGDLVLVTGMGPVGALTALYASAMGCEVVMAEPNAKRAAFARGLDIGTVLDPAHEDVGDHVRSVSAGEGVSATIECSGSAAALTTAIEVTKRRGTVVQTGLHTRPATVLMSEVSRNDLSIIGSWCYFVYDWPRMIRLVGTGRFPIEKIVTTQVGIDDTVAGFDALIDPNGNEVKVLISANERLTR
jgi:(R,R)-butanediol dehydrogenase/meso-butanediol dehydrogenase/diacetyl reductase